jgi:hypothetical protein
VRSAGMPRVMSAPSGTVTFLFTDIEGSTRLWQLDEVAMRAAFSREHITPARASLDPIRFGMDRERAGIGGPPNASCARMFSRVWVVSPYQRCFGS